MGRYAYSNDYVGHWQYQFTCQQVAYSKFLDTLGFLGQFRQMSSQFNHQAVLFLAKSNATEKGHSNSFYDQSNASI